MEQFNAEIHRTHARTQGVALTFRSSLRRICGRYKENLAHPGPDFAHRALMMIFLFVRRSIAPHVVISFAMEANSPDTNDDDN